MKLLVTGGAGYIGSHVTRQLSEARHDVVVLDNLIAGFKESLLNYEKLVTINLLDADQLNTLFSQESFDAVIHLAAYQSVSESVKEPGKYFRNNTVGTLQLIETCLKHQVHKLIFSSTAALYGSPSGGIAKETTPPSPLNPYGYSKYVAECMLNSFSECTPLSYVALRYFNVAGADPQCRIGQRTQNATHLIKVACETATRQRPMMPIYGNDYQTPDGTAIRDYIHVEDLSRAHLQALEYLSQKSDSTVLNVGYGHGYSVFEVVKEVQRISGYRFETKMEPRRPGDSEQLIADNQKIKDVLQWKPQYDSLTQIVTDAYNWELKLTQSSVSTS